MLAGEDLELCMKLGNAVAALKCRALGARAALPTAEELSEFVRPGANSAPGLEVEGLI
jgi:sugar/nucleoside kinase (ribokinase family)